MDRACRGAPAEAPAVARAEGHPVLNNRQLAAALCDGSPALRELCRAHELRHGTLIPHVFMGEVVAHIGTCVRAEWLEPGTRAPEIAAILECLERAMAGGDRETRNVVSLSFARDCEMEPFFATLKPQLGPRLRAQLDGR